MPPAPSLWLRLWLYYIIYISSILCVMTVLKAWRSAYCPLSCSQRCLYSVLSTSDAGITHYVLLCYVMISVLFDSSGVHRRGGDGSYTFIEDKYLQKKYDALPFICAFHAVTCVFFVTVPQNVPKCVYHFFYLSVCLMLASNSEAEVV